MRMINNISEEIAVPSVKNMEAADFSKMSVANYRSTQTSKLHDKFNAINNNFKL
jgi:hypothetical protein